MNKKKVLHIAYSGLGGQSTVALSIPDADSTCFYNHHFVFFGIENTHSNNEKRAKGISAIERINSIKKKTGFDFRSLWQLFQILKQSKPSVIICHMPSLFLPVFMYWLFRKTKIIFVEHHSIQLRSKLSLLVSNFNILFANNIVCLTENYRSQFLSKMMFIPKFISKKVVIQSNAINEKLFIEDFPKTMSETKCITMVGRFNAGKDHSTLLKATRDLVSSGYSLKLSLPGDGDTLEDCKILSSELKLSEMVNFPGMISELEIIKVLQLTDIFVLSTAGETQSLSILQAMACRIPVIASNVPGVSDMIAHGKTGLLFEYKNHDDLALNIAKLINDKQLRSKIVTAASVYFDSNHSYKNFFEGYKNIIEK